MARSRKRVGSAIVVGSATIALVVALLAPTTGAATQYPAVDQPGS